MDGKRIWRTTNERASELYIKGEANYTTKSEWKEKVRDVNKKKETPQEDKPKSNRKVK